MSSDSFAARDDLCENYLIVSFRSSDEKKKTLRTMWIQIGARIESLKSQLSSLIKSRATEKPKRNIPLGWDEFANILRILFEFFSNEQIFLNEL